MCCVKMKEVYANAIESEAEESSRRLDRLIDWIQLLLMMMMMAMQCRRRTATWLLHHQLSRTLSLSSVDHDYVILLFYSILFNSILFNSIQYLTPSSQVLVEGNGYSRMSLLNRPSSLNAINTHMAARLHQLYTSWEHNPHIGFLMLKGTGRSFAAGGDIVALYRFLNKGQTFSFSKFDRRLHP